MNYIDTHCHLNDEKIMKHFDEVVDAAFKNNVTKIFVVGWDLDSSKKALEYAHKYPWCFAMIGFHPENIKGYGDKEYTWLKENAKDEKVIAIGEIGFDLYWDSTTLEEQKEAFKRQVEIAREVNKPISVHSRDAMQITFDEIMNNKAYEVGGIIHSYSGSTEMAKEYVKRNFLLGISGVVTFKNAKAIKETVKEISLDYLVSETDSPYLAPTPHRGEENGPLYIPLIVDDIANIKNVTKEEVCEKINSNVLRKFGV